MLSTYTIKSKNSNNLWQFKYHLNGDLSVFEILEGSISEKQKTWLFRLGNFPSTESIMTDKWMQKLKKNFEITVGEPDLSFNNYWNVYNNKVGKKKMAQNIWERMGRADRIKVFINIPKYKNYLKHYPKQQMMYPTTYLNQEAYDNEWKVN